MRTAGDLRTDERRLGVEAVGIDPLEIIAAVIVVAVTAGGGKTGSRSVGRR